MYAYVSRGLIAAAPDPSDPRRSLYDALDVRSLLERKRRGRSRKAVAAGTVNWGEPVLSSAVTEVSGQRLYYRGVDAVALSGSATLEGVASVLWAAGDAVLEFPLGGWLRQAGTGKPVAERCMARLAALNAAGPWTARPGAAVAPATILVAALADAVAPPPAPIRAARPLHRRLADAWKAGDPAADAIRRALVLCADHELNASTYTARVVASTRAPLGSCLLAALAALTGPLHGGTTARVAALMSDPGVGADPQGALSSRLARGEAVPGFGHPLYPDGDPRARALIDAVPMPKVWQAVADAVFETTGKRPNVDFALAALEAVLGLPADSAFGIFALGRSVGWVAHVLEQWSEGGLIRPRARYVGPPAGKGS